MNLAPSLDPCLSWWGDTLSSSPLGHSHSLASKEAERRRQTRQAFVRGENWLLLPRAGAPGTDMKKGPSVRRCRTSNPIPWGPCSCVIYFEPRPASHTPCSLCPIPDPVFLIPCPACVPWCTVHVLRPMSLTPWITHHAPCHFCCVMYSV